LTLDFELISMYIYTSHSSHEIPLGKTTDQAKNGFTLVELITVIAIISVLMTIGVPSYRTYQKRIELDQQAEQIISILRQAQNQSVTSFHNQNFGVHFEEDRFILFEGEIYSPADPDNITYNLPSTLQIYDINLAGGGTDVIFSKLRGVTEQEGSLKVKTLTDPSIYQEISINSEGVVTKHKVESGYTGCGC